MKIPKEPVSAFAVYSEKLRQKKKRNKPTETNGVSKLKKKSEKKKGLNIKQMEEINNIMESLIKKSNNSGKLTSDTKEAETSSEHLNSQPKKLKVKNKNKVRSKNTDKHVMAEKCKAVNQDLYEKSTNVELNQTNTLHSKSEKTNVPIKKKNATLKKWEKIKSKKVVNTELSTRASERKGFNENVATKIKKREVKNARKESAYDVFKWLILPITENHFMSDYWEKKPLLIQRENNRTYYSEVISTLQIDSMIRKNNVQFTKNLDITSYTDGKRETHNLSGRAQANVVWDFYSNGCSVRLLNPQVFLPKIHILNATLQGYFGCFVGANVYLTPPNSQGFAPHYDDIEAFVLQIEGKKHWKVYAPRSDAEMLPRYSSPNFSQSEIGEPVLDVTLEPGDLLYFPRGFIHQASTVEGEHSLHITLSAYQKTAWVDLLEKAIPLALKRAAEKDVEFRRGLPRDYLGLEFHGSDAAKMSFTSTAQRLMSQVAKYLPYTLGAAVDKMGAQFMHDALPPFFTPDEKQNMVLGSGLKMKDKGKLVGRVEIEMETEVKLARANICRLVEEEGELRLYHCLDNPLEYHSEEPQFLVLPEEGADIITQLSTQHPRYVQVQALPHTDKEALLTLVSDLWDAGLLMIKDLQTVDD